MWVEEDVYALELMLQQMLGREDENGDSTQATTSLTIVLVYNPSSEGNEEGAVLITLRGILPINKQPIVIMSDFNLHHPIWMSPEYCYRHKTADHLVDIMHSFR